MAKKAKKKHAGGRPTKYKAEYATEAFINKYKAYCVKEEILISLCSFAVYVRVTEDTLANWGKAHKEFLGSLGEISQSSKNMLISKGLDGDYNSTIAKLILSSNHGMCERKHIEGEMALNVIIER